MGQPGPVPSSSLLLHPEVHLDDRRGQEGWVFDPEELEDPCFGQGRKGEGAEQVGRILDEEQRNTHQNGADLPLLRSAQFGKYLNMFDDQAEKVS